MTEKESREAFGLAIESISFPVKYDDNGCKIFDAENNLVLDIRGHGHLQYMEGGLPKSIERQDNIGNLVEYLLNSFAEIWNIPKKAHLVAEEVIGLQKDSIQKGLRVLMNNYLGGGGLIPTPSNQRECDELLKIFTNQEKLDLLDTSTFVTLMMISNDQKYDWKYRYNFFKMMEATAISRHGAERAKNILNGLK